MAPEYIIVPIEVAHRDFLPVEQEARGRKPEKGEKGKVSLEKAERIMDKKNFIGPDALKKIYGIEPKDVPPISFSEPELREAKERGEFLILRLDTLPNGKPTTMQNLNEYFASDFKTLYNAKDDWKVKSEFFTKETPEVSWALVSKDFVPESISKNYLEQTKVLADHLKNEVYKGSTMPKKYDDAIKEFDAYMNAAFPAKTAHEIQTALGGENWSKYAEQLANLKINQLCRQSGAASLFDLATYYKHTGEYLLPDTVTWTNSRYSDGNLVHAGSFDSDGVSVYGWSPGSALGYLGVLLSRTADQGLVT